MPHLFMTILGCSLKNRFTEQHDVFFSIADSLEDMVEDMYAFWPEGGKTLHVDSFRKVSLVDSYTINVLPRNSNLASSEDLKLFFLNLGGYKRNDLEEYHYKQLVVANDMDKAISSVKKSSFWKEHDLSHVDDKYALDVDDIYPVEDMLPTHIKEKYFLSITTVPNIQKVDLVTNGYFKLSELVKNKS